MLSRGWKRAIEREQEKPVRLSEAQRLPIPKRRPVEAIGVSQSQTAFYPSEHGTNLLAETALVCYTALTI